MSRAGRWVALGVLVACGVAIIALLQRAQVQPPIESTFTSAFQVLGAPLKLVEEVKKTVEKMLEDAEYPMKRVADIHKDVIALNESISKYCIVRASTSQFVQKQGDGLKTPLPSRI